MEVGRKVKGNEKLSKVQRNREHQEGREEHINKGGLMVKEGGTIRKKGGRKGKMYKGEDSLIVSYLQTSPTHNPLQHCVAGTLNEKWW